MYLPELDKFTKMTEQAGVVPLHRTVLADLDFLGYDMILFIEESRTAMRS